MPAIIDAVYAENMSLRSLRDELLQHHSSINYRESPDADWGSDVVGDVGIVVYAEDRRRPASCLGHELLHLKLQAQGYRRIRCGVSNFAESNWLRQFLTAMDNELQHQRMFDQFLAMGFRSEQFYGSAETGIVAHLDGVLSRATEDIRTVICHYLGFIAPGGKMKQADRDNFKKRFHSVKKGKFAPILQEVDNAVAEWRNGQDLNVQVPARRIMLALDPNTRTWFGHTSPPVFPDEGFFVGDHFVQ